MSDMSLSRLSSQNSASAARRLPSISESADAPERDLLEVSEVRSRANAFSRSEIEHPDAHQDLQILQADLEHIEGPRVEVEEALPADLNPDDPVSAFNHMINLTEELTKQHPALGEASRLMLRTLGEGLELTAEAPSSQLQIASLREGLEKMHNELDQQLTALQLSMTSVKDSLPPETLQTLGTLARTLAIQVRHQHGMIDSKLAYIERQHLEHPTSKKEIARAKSLWTEAALRDVRAQIQLHHQDPTKLKELGQLEFLLLERVAMFQNEQDSTAIVGKQAIGELMGAKKESWFTFGLKKKGAVTKTLEQFQNGEMRWSSKNLREQDMLKVVLKETYRHLGLGDATEALTERLEHHHIEVLNDQPWAVIDRSVQLQLGGRQLEFGSKISPAGMLGNVFDSYRGKGISSATTDERVHAVNLAATEFTAPNGKVLFKGLRHGIHSAFGLANAEDRRVANLSRARETLQAALLMNPELAARALQGESVELDLNSISLVTPDSFRGRGTPADPLQVGRIKKTNEKAMLAEQLAAWNALDGQEQTLQLKGPDGALVDVRLTPHINAFNCGVNQGGFGSLSALIGSWGPSDQANEKALKRFLGEEGLSGGAWGGRVGRQLAALEQKLAAPELGAAEKRQLQKEAAIIRELAEQIQTIWATQAHHESGPDPYKMVARLAVLSHMMGDATAFNCKSGKDRTGELDVEAKFLALQIERTGHVPSYDRPLTDEEQTIFRSLALQGGNLEIQRLNVSAGGFKLEGVDAITDRLGGKDPKEVHRGLSKHFES
jgi:hypothetical protein